MARAFPKEFDRAKAEYDKNPTTKTHAERVLSNKLGKKVKNRGGDEMKSDEEYYEG